MNQHFEIPNTPVPVRPKDFLDLLELTHELSNSVGLTMNLLTGIPADIPQRLLDQLATAMEEATKATCILRKLMWQLGEIRRSAVKEDHASDISLLANKPPNWER